MRSLFTFFLLLLCTISASAQQKYSGSYSEQFDGSEWSPYDSVLISYGANNLPITELTYFYAPPWGENQKISKTYNSVNQLASEIIEIAVGGKLTNSEKKTYSYGWGGLVEKTTIYKAGSSSWDLHSSIQHTYDGKGKLISEISRMPDPSGHGADIEYAQRKLIYNTQGELTEELFLASDNAGGWKDSARISYSHDASKNLIEIHELYIDNQWSAQLKIISQFDSKGLRIFSLRQISFGGEWFDYIKTKYHYKKEVSGIESREAEPEFTLFPNPADEHITISGLPREIKGLTLYDPGGRTYRVTPVLADGFSFNVSALPEGLYILVLQAGESGSKPVYRKITIARNK